MPSASTRSSLHRWVLTVAFIVAALVYWPGLYGSFLFDDYPNIVDNQNVQPHENSVASLVRAALSSPSSEFKRPLASLSFAANYLASGLDPFWMKLANLGIHLFNGVLVFVLARIFLTAAILKCRDRPMMPMPKREHAVGHFDQSLDWTVTRAATVAAIIAACWMLLPINLTGVLYIVQRMESMANIFVLLGLIGYATGRCAMLGIPLAARLPQEPGRISIQTRGFCLSLLSITILTTLGLLAKETAAMLPFYAFLTEWTLFHFRTDSGKWDRRIVILFTLVLVLPLCLGLAWLLPGILKPQAWAVRDFTMETRLLSEARIIVDYIVWTLLPTPAALSFYHDDFQISTGLLAPWSTSASMFLLGALVALTFWLRRRRPLVALGISLFLGCQLLTGTVLPLELIYEHRNYFASFGLLLAVVPWLAVPRTQPFALPRHVLLVGLILCWTGLTGLTAYVWGNPLRLAEDLANRVPGSPRAQYELGRTYIIYSHYDPDSPYTRLAYAPLEKAAALPQASILPEQALIFMNARMHLPPRDRWWASLIAKLKARKSGVQDESSLSSLTQCARELRCDLPKNRMMEAFMAALSHPDPSAHLLATYGDYSWNVLGDKELGKRMTEQAVQVDPKEPAYRITLIRMLVALDQAQQARAQLQQLGKLNIAGRLNDDMTVLKQLTNDAR
ncbi:MAG: hypothetical protein V4566_10195 [Pseudomonadota bacterium]|jgi:protein O-mannosyl-transferase